VKPQLATSLPSSPAWKKEHQGIISTLPKEGKLERRKKKKREECQQAV
jgi:hypothetical protein